MRRLEGEAAFELFQGRKKARVLENGIKIFDAFGYTTARSVANLTLGQIAMGFAPAKKHFSIFVETLGYPTEQHAVAVQGIRARLYVHGRLIDILQRELMSGETILKGGPEGREPGSLLHLRRPPVGFGLMLIRTKSAVQGLAESQLSAVHFCIDSVRIQSGADFNQSGVDGFSAGRGHERVTKFQEVGRWHGVEQGRVLDNCFHPAGDPSNEQVGVGVLLFFEDSYDLIYLKEYLEKTKLAPLMNDNELM